MALSETSLSNMALRKFGAQPLSSYEDPDDVNAERCREYFWPTCDALLRQHDWNFASARAKLTELETAPAFGFDNSFALPTSPYCLKVRAMVNEDTDDSLDPVTYPWRVEDRSILCNENPCYIRYTKRITDVSRFDSLFVQVFVYLLAVELAPAVIQDKRFPAELAKWLASFWKPTALSADSSEGSVRRMAGKTLLHSRILGTM